MNTTMNQGFELIHDMFRLRWIPEIITSINAGYNSYSDILSHNEFLSHTELNRKLNLLVDREAIIKKDDKGTTGYYLLDFGNDLAHMFRHFEDMSAKYILKVSDRTLV